MAVLSSQEEKPKDGNTSVCEDDSELNKAFVEGQDMSMEISVRDSISAINEIQEQIQTDNLDSGSTGVCTKKPFVFNRLFSFLIGSWFN